MNCNKIFCVLVLGIILPLLLIVFPAIPTRAGDGNGVITLNPNKGKLGDWIVIDGYRFDANKIIHIYFSSDEANIGDYIDAKVTTYEYIGTASINTGGEFDTPSYFKIPDRLVDGEEEEDVHGGDYYFYATYYFGKKRIEAVTRFRVINGEIALDPKEGQVDTEVEISGEGLRNSQKITIKYDDNDVDIVSGDNKTDSDGKFSCTIIIPESIAGSHTITVTDESGNKPKAEFSVEPKITIAPTSQAVGKTVKINGTGFGKREIITVTLEGYGILTTLRPIDTSLRGSFQGDFLVPSDAGYGTSRVEAHDESLNVAEAQLTTFILAIPADISLSPTTSRTSPGHVGMELTVDGTRFMANTMVTITYSNSETITVATATTTGNGNFSATFTVPPSVAGSYTVTATDGTNSATSVFTMESEAPSMPVPLLPEVAATTEAEAYFDWKDVTDPSEVTYILQLGTDDNFTAVVLEKKGLTDSEYTLTGEEKLESTKKGAPYYWRVKATDGAFNESEWTTPRSFYVGFSWASISAWAVYIWIGLGASLLVILGFWVRRRITA